MTTVNSRRSYQSEYSLLVEASIILSNEDRLENVTADTITQGNIYHVGVVSQL